MVICARLPVTLAQARTIHATTPMFLDCWTAERYLPDPTPSGRRVKQDIQRYQHEQHGYCYISPT